MNHLGHLFLARDDSALMAGAFLGDFVKGRLTGERPNAIERGIQFHRATDAYVDAHAAQHRSINRFEPEFRRYGGIICDVVYDHFLANYWSEFSPQLFTQFCDNAYEQVLKQHVHLSPEAIKTMTRMRQYGSLEGYQSETYIDRSLGHIATRLSRTNPLDRAFSQYQNHAADLEQDFFEFMPDLLRFARTWRDANAGPQTN